MWDKEYLDGLILLSNFIISKNCDGNMDFSVCVEYVENSEFVLVDNSIVVIV